MPTRDAVEERVGTAAAAERQFVWGLRYVDDLALRDRDSTGNGTLNERLFGMQDPNWNVTAVADTSGTVQERYGYDAYGMLAVLTPDFVPRLATLYDWETQYAGYRRDGDTGLYQVRNRILQGSVGWVQRDPVGTSVSNLTLYSYLDGRPEYTTDPQGLFGAIGGPILPVFLLPIVVPNMLTLTDNFLRAPSFCPPSFEWFSEYRPKLPLLPVMIPPMAPPLGSQGWVVQHVISVRFVATCDCKQVQSRAIEYWEAYPINGAYSPLINLPRPQRYEPTFFGDVFSFNTGVKPPPTFGFVAIRGYAMYVAGNWFPGPPNWKVGDIPDALWLPTTTTRPPWWVENGGISRALFFSWQCCGWPRIGKGVITVNPKPGR